MSGSRKSPKSKRPTTEVRQTTRLLGRDDVIRVGWFGAVFLSSYWLMTLGAASAFASWMREWTATAAGESLRVLGRRIVLSGCSVVAGDSTTTVTQACLPIAALALGFALVLVSNRLTIWGKVMWTAAVLIVVPLVNVGRIAVVALLAEQHSPFLRIAHVHLLPMVMVLSAIGLWLLAEKVGPHA